MRREFIVLDHDGRVEARLHGSLEKEFHPRVTLEFYFGAVGAEKCLPFETNIVGEVSMVEVIDSVVDAGGKFGAIKRGEVENVGNHENREHIECIGAGMDLADGFLPKVYVFSNEGLRIKCGR